MDVLYPIIIALLLISLMVGFFYSTRRIKNFGLRETQLIDQINDQSKTINSQSKQIAEERSNTQKVKSKLTADLNLQNKKIEELKAELRKNGRTRVTNKLQ